jgi:hypothetical protein
MNDGVQSERQGDFRKGVLADDMGFYFGQISLGTIRKKTKKKVGHNDSQH